MFLLCSWPKRSGRSLTATWMWWTGTNRWWRPRTPLTSPLRSLRYRTAAPSLHLWWSESLSLEHTHTHTHFFSPIHSLCFNYTHNSPFPLCLIIFWITQHHSEPWALLARSRYLAAFFKTLPLCQNPFKQSVVVPVVAPLYCSLTLQNFTYLGLMYDVFFCVCLHQLVFTGFLVSWWKLDTSKHFAAQTPIVCTVHINHRALWKSPHHIDPAFQPIIISSRQKHSSKPSSEREREKEKAAFSSNLQSSSCLYPSSPPLHFCLPPLYQPM